MSGLAVSAAAFPGRLGHARRVRLARLAVVLLGLLLWQAASWSGLSAEIAPGPITVARAVPRLLQDGPVTRALLATLAELAAAFVLSVLIGGAIGYALSAGLRIERVGLPILLLLYALPQITVLPLFVLYFGLGAAAKIAFGVSHGLFPVALGVHAGMKQARPHYLRWAMSLGAGPWQRFVRLFLPQLLPALCTGMRLAMSMTLLGVLLAELYVSSLGIGFYIQLYTNALQGDALFALVFMLAAIAVALNAGVGLLERRAGRWRT